MKVLSLVDRRKEEIIKQDVKKAEKLFGMDDGELQEMLDRGLMKATVGGDGKVRYTTTEYGAQVTNETKKQMALMGKTL